MKDFLSYKKETFAPSEVRPIGITFSRLVILEASFRFYASMEGEEEIPLDLGLKCDFGRILGGLTIRNPSEDASLTVEFMYGTGDFTDNRFNVVTTRENQFVQFADAPTIAQATNVTLAAGTSQEFSNAARENTDCGRRKHLVITNLDAAETLLIKCDTDHVSGEPAALDYCAAVGPKQSFIIESSDSFTIANPGLVPVTCYVLETFYRVA